MDNKIYIGNKIYRGRVLFLFSFILYLVVMHMNVGAELADDGAFFLRYADNIVKGNFWVWNIGEDPVWGASAPLYPVLVAIPMFFGVSSVTSLIWTGIVISALSFSFVCIILYRKLGLFSVVCFLLFTLTDVNLMYFSVSGLESPLVFLLLALSFYCIIEEKSELAIGLLAAMLAIHKLDMIPVGGLLLACHWMNTRKIPVRATLVTIAVCLTWYGFAWGYFGAPVPNSFITKSLLQNDLPKSIDWTWFGGLVLFQGMHLTFVALSLFLFVVRRHLVCFFFFGGILFIHILAYSIKYPFEPYVWYAMPSVFSIALLGAMGGHVIQEFLSNKLGRHVWVMGLSLLIVFSFFSVNQFNKSMKDIQYFINYQEHDRAQAGRWVDENTPKEFRVFTLWGNPAYFSKRYVYDGSFLNRKFDEAEGGDLIKKYNPEILILQNNPGSKPNNPVFAFTKGERYRVVKIFDKSYRAGMDYFFVVLAREDVLEEIDDITMPQNYMRFIRNTTLGSHYGELKVYGVDSLFLHPGFNTPTTFEFLVEKAMVDSEQSKLHFSFTIASNVPEEAISRGGADAYVTVMDSTGKELHRGSVNHMEKLEFKLDRGDVDRIKFVIDSKGNPDSDWVILTIKEAKADF